MVKAGKIDSAKADTYKAAARKALLEQWKPAYDQLIAWFESELPKADASRDRRRQESERQGVL